MFIVNYFFSSEINGTIKDENASSLAWVKIIEKGTLNGTQTNFEGNYVLYVSSESVISVVSYIGFTTKENASIVKNTIDFIIEEVASGGGELIVVGYGIERKKDLTGAVASLDSNQIEGLPDFNMLNQILGRV
ncbi:MAG: carboxypeptidase-like regulatory domain-containing protein [Maribacter sp.]